MITGETYPKLKFIDLFSGIGGFRLALEKYGMECVFSSEWDKDAQKTYEANFGNKPEGDITKIEESTIPEHNILCAGFPCQAFSISGKQRGFEDTSGTLFFDIARIARYRKPEILFLENVKNFARHDSGKTLKVVLDTLDDIGYLTFHKVLNASFYGVPTARKRIYIVAFRKDLGIKNFRFPSPKNVPVKLLNYLLPESEVPKELFIKRDDIKLRDIKINQLLDNSFPQKPIRVGTINKGGQGERIYSDLGHAITLSAYGGGAGSKTGAYLVNHKVRKLAPRECARVMGFPDDFKIPVSTTQAHKQFGNSVAVPVLESIFESIVRVYNGYQL